MKLTTLVPAVLSLICTVQSWSPSVPTYSRRSTIKSRLFMGIDYNDPAVAEEFMKVQGMTFEEVEAEIMSSGIPVPQTMNDMDAKLMLVELRMRLSGSLNDDNDAKKEETIPTSFSSKFEEALYTKPAFKELYNLFKDRGDTNSMNVAAEYVNSPKEGRVRYGDSYASTLDQIDRALTTEMPVTSPIVKFSGFPANMGGDACKMTLEGVGAVAEFECAESEDFPILEGKVTFEDIDSAKAAIKQYNGMDMGMGAKLELKSVE